MTDFNQRIIVPCMSTKDIITADYLFGKVRRNLLALFLLNPGRSYYLLELVRLLKTGRGGVQRELANLVNAGIIRREKAGIKVFFTSADISGIAAALVTLLEQIVFPEELLNRLVRDAPGIKIAVRTAVARKGDRKRLSILLCGDFSEDDIQREIEEIELLTGSSIERYFFRGSNIPARISAEGNRLEWIEFDSSVFIKGKLTSLIMSEIAEEPREYDLFSQADIDWKTTD